MEEFLVQMIAHVEKEYSDIERECVLLRSLLRPWPKKKQLSQEISGQDAKQTDDHVKEKDNDLTPIEKQALEEMDRLLNKAQKAISIKEKVSIVKESPDVTDSSKSCQIGNGKAVQNLKEIKENKPVCKKSSIMENGSIETKNKETVAAHKREVTGIKKNLPQPGTKELKLSQGSSSRLSSSKSITPRPSSVTNSVSRPSSCRSRFTPAHANAPFKTDVNTRVPHRKNNHIYKNHLVKAPHKKNTTIHTPKQSSHLNGLKTLPKIASDVPEKDSVNISQGFNDKDTNIEDDNSCNTTPQSISITADSKALAQGMEDDKQETNLKPECAVSDHKQNKVSGNLERLSLKEEDFFSLKDKSCQIKVPPRFQKLVSENHALLEKCSTAKLVKKMPNSDAGFNFIERLHETNELSREMWAKAKAMTCLQSHILMLKSLKSLGIESLSATSSYDTIYRAKTLLEFILSKFAQSQEEADYFSKVIFKQPHFLGISRPTLDNEIARESFFKNRETQSKHKANHAVMEALMNSKTWTRLQFQKNSYQLQLQMMSLSESEWWQFLVQNPENDGAVQMIHSLLTSCGEFFPAFVENPFS